jgi:hypothetical protein
MNAKQCTSGMPLIALFALAMPPSAQAGFLDRLAADFAKFDGTEFVTVAPALPAPPASGGTVIYSRVVVAPPGVNTLYVTLSGTGDTHDGAASEFACLVDGQSCRTNPGGVDGAPNGWITLKKLPAALGAPNCNDGGGGPGDCHDNSIYYTWCATVRPNPFGPTPHKVAVKMATSKVGSKVFIEKVHFYVDANVGPGGQCQRAPAPAGLPGVGASEAGQ